MHARALVNSARPVSTAETDSVHTGSNSTSTTASPSSRGRRRSGLPAPLAADALSCSVTGTSHTRVDGALSCPVARSSGVSSIAPSDVPRMPVLTPTASTPASQAHAASRNAPHSAGARRSARGSITSSAQLTPLPPPGTPSQSPRRGDTLTAHGSPNSSVAARGGGGSASHTPVSLGSPLPSRLPAMLQPGKLSAGGGGSSGANAVSPTSTPTSLQPQALTPPQRQRRPASTATMTAAPSSPARLVSRPDVTQLTFTSPARRCLLMTDAGDPAAHSRGAPSTSQLVIPPPPPPLPPSPASASANAAAAAAAVSSTSTRPSSTSSIAPSRGSPGRSASPHHREGGRTRSATTAGAAVTASTPTALPNASGGADAYLRENPRVRTLVNNLYQHVLAMQPEQPLQYLAQLPTGTVGQLAPPARQTPTSAAHGDGRRSSSSGSRVSTYPPQTTAQTQPAATQQQQQQPSPYTAGRTRARRLPPATTPPQQSITAASRRGTEDGMSSTNSAVSTSARPQSSPQSREGQQSQANSHASGGARRRSSLESDTLRSGGGGEAVGSRHSSLNAPDGAATDTEARQPHSLLRTPPLVPASSASGAPGGVAFARSGLAMPPAVGLTTSTTTMATTTTVTSAAHASGGITSTASSKHGSPALLSQRVGLTSAASYASSGAAGHATGGNLGMLLRSGSGIFRGGGLAGQHSTASFVGSASGLDRGEGMQSDLSSVLSTNSVDLQEFLAEFRMAKEDICGSGVDRPAITLDELAQIIESSSFPCPDAEVLLDLFDELQPCARYLAGTLLPSSPQLPASNAAAAVSSLLKRNTTSPLPQRLGLASALRSAGGGGGRDVVFHLGANMPPRGAAGTQSLGSFSSVSSFNGAVTSLDGNAPAAAAASLGSSGKSRAGAAAAALYGTANTSANGWAGQLRAPGNESCVTAAHPPSSYATHTQGRLADDAQQQQQQYHGQQPTGAGALSGVGRAEGKVAAVAVESRIVGDGHRDSHPFQNPNPYQRGCSDMFGNGSPLQSHGGASRPFSAAVGVAEGDETAATVPFDTLLARMAYKIQGRYPSEALRIAFFGMVVDDESVPDGSVNIAALEGSGRGVDGAYGRGTRGTISSDSLAPSEPVGMSGGSAGTAGGGYGTLPSCTVPLRRCVAEGLFARLGMVDVTANEVHRGLRNAGLPTSPDDQRSWECHLEDFVWLVRAVTAAVERGSNGVSPANLFLTSLRESHLQRGGNPGAPASASWREDPTSATAPAPSSAASAPANPAAFSGLC